MSLVELAHSDPQQLDQDYPRQSLTCRNGGRQLSLDADADCSQHVMSASGGWGDSLHRRHHLAIPASKAGALCFAVPALPPVMADAGAGTP